eukprot:s2065_g3.t1
MQYIRARDAGLFPGLFMPYKIDVEELSLLMPHAPASFCALLWEVLRTPHMAPLWASEMLPLLTRKCLICGHEASDAQLTAHLNDAHSLALNSAMMLQANLAAMLLVHFGCSASQPQCPICAAPCAGMTVQQHLVSCPILHQIAWVLSKPCHGRGDYGTAASCATGRRVSPHGPIAEQAGAQSPSALTTQNTLWAVTDDLVIPAIHQLPGLPEWICRNITLVFLVAMHAVDVYRPLRDPGAGWMRLRELRKQVAHNLASPSEHPSQGQPAHHATPAIQSGHCTDTPVNTSAGPDSSAQSAVDPMASLVRLIGSALAQSDAT